MKGRFDAKDFLPVGRTLDEYSRIFGLRFTELKNAQVLDAGGGVSSFTAEANELGLSVISADTLYKFPPDRLEELCRKGLESMFRALEPVRDNYNWDFYKNEEGLRKYREEACEKFIKDYREHRWKRYIHTDFPFTVFTDKEFDITLMSHFLFLYDEHADYDFHLDTIDELMRITKEEIRIYPLINLRYERSGFLGPVMKESRFKKARFELKKTGFEFLKGADEYLSIKL